MKLLFDLLACCVRERSVMRRFDAGILLIGPLGTNFHELLNIFIEENSFKNVVCEMLFIQSRPQCVNIYIRPFTQTWWRHQMETFPAWLAICAGNSPVTDEFPAQRPVTRSFDVFFDLCLDKRLGKQSWGWWFETPSHSVWRHRNEYWGLCIVCASYIFYFRRFAREICAFSSIVLVFHIYNVTILFLNDCNKTQFLYCSQNYFMFQWLKISITLNK